MQIYSAPKVSRMTESKAQRGRALASRESLQEKVCFKGIMKGTRHRFSNREGDGIPDCRGMMSKSKGSSNGATSRNLKKIRLRRAKLSGGHEKYTK